MKPINTIEQQEVYDIIKKYPNILQADILEILFDKEKDGKKVYKSVNSARSTVSRLCSTLEARQYIKRKEVIGKPGVPQNSWKTIK